MNRSFPLRVAPSGARGPKRKSGARYPNGKLKKETPNPRILEIRRLIADDPRMAENPLDAALANGWLTEAEHRAGRAYARLCAMADLGAPRASRAALPEQVAAAGPRSAGPGEPAHVEPAASSEAAIPQAPGGSDSRHESAVRAMAAWRQVGAAVRAAARAELHSVCVLEAWPEWLLRRLTLAAIRKTAEAQKRALDAGELEELARGFDGPWEVRRSLLIEGLAGVAAVLRPAPPDRAAQPAPRPSPPIRPSVLESARYVTPDGELLFEVERRGGPPSRKR